MCEKYNIKKKCFVNKKIQYQIFDKLITKKTEDDIFDTNTSIILDNKKDDHLLKEPIEFTEEQRERVEEKRERIEKKNAYRNARRAKNEIYDLCRANQFDFFITLTFNPEKVDSFNYEECSEKLSHYLERLHAKNKQMKHIVIPEKHKSGRYHFHGLFANIDESILKDSGLTTADGDIIYNLGNYRLGYTTATRIKDTHKASNYLCKYISKDLCCVTKNKKRYWRSKNLDNVLIDTQKIDKAYEDIIADITRSHKAVYIKEIHNPFGRITYIEIEE